MISARHFGTKSAAGALALVLGLSAAASAATISPRGAVRTVAPLAATHNFAVLHAFAGLDGSAPAGNLDLAVQVSSNKITRTLYGLTEGGGATGSGSIYSFGLGTNVFSSLYSFTGGNDGATPIGGLANNELDYFAAGSVQLGVTNSGGAYGFGTVYSINAAGTVSVIHAFTGSTDGANPAGRLTRFTDGNYYGTTVSGGANDFGTIFRITPSGTFATVYNFTGAADGGAPQAGLNLLLNVGSSSVAPSMRTMSAVASSSAYVSRFLYGTTSTGSTNGVGTIFRFNPATGKLQNLHIFTGNADGGVPAARLISDFHGNLYGTASVGGSAGNGIVFELPFNSTALRVLHDFGDGTTGASPAGQLTFGFNGNLYGTTSAGGASGIYGDIFEISSNGTFSDIYDFTGGNDGGSPEGSLIDGGDGKLYGTTTAGGANTAGVLFSIGE